jgi:hypothetical protein
MARRLDWRIGRLVKDAAARRSRKNSWSRLPPPPWPN